MNRSSRTVFQALREPQNKKTMRTISIAAVVMFVLPLGLFFLARNVMTLGDQISAVIAVVAAQAIIAAVVIIAFNEEQPSEAAAKKVK